MAELLPHAGKAIQQFSFVDALVAGLLDGAFEASEVARHGDFGVGCGDALDGELVLLDGIMYVCRGDGSVALVGPDELLPFAEVVRFEPTLTTELPGGLGEREFDALVESLVPSQNLFYAIRVNASFESMTVREATRQLRPFPGLSDAVKTQHENTVEATTGTLVGFKGPDVFQGLSVADFHLHYIDDARAFGGHVLDFEMSAGTLFVEAYSTFTLRLPEVASYLAAELDDINSDAAIRAAES